MDKPKVGLKQPSIFRVLMHYLIRLLQKMLNNQMYFSHWVKRAQHFLE